jgi:outer membrane protein TolC
MEESRRDMTVTQAELSRSDFEQNVFKTVKQFNSQNRNFAIAAKTDQYAEHRYDIARKLYLLERSSILDLNNAIAEKDEAKRGYINALSTYWQLYYMIRSLTLFDFEKGIPLTEDYQMLIK